MRPTGSNRPSRMAMAGVPLSPEFNPLLTVKALAGAAFISLIEPGDLRLLEH